MSASVANPAASGGGSSTPTGTAGSPTASVVSVQGVSGGTAVPVSLSGNISQETGGNLATIVSNQGTDNTGVTQVSGGTGERGWLSGIYKALTGILGVNLSQVSGAALSAANGIPIYDAYLSPQAVSWTSATAVNTALTFSTAGMDTVAVTLNTPATFTAGVITFQVWDGTNWMPVKCPRLESYSVDQTFSMVGVASIHSWTIPVAGFPQARVLLSTAIVGSGTAGIVGLVSSTPDTSLVTVGLDPSQPLPAGTNAIGGVTVSSLPALPAGTNAIGGVTVSSLPALPAGTNTIGTVNTLTNPVAPATIATNQVAMTATVASIVAARTGAIGTGRVKATIYNMGANTIYVGVSGVTAATGMPILPGGSFDHVSTAALYGICGTSLTSTAAYVDTY